ncbi:MAG: alpha-2-macroglobulin family protein, partial [Blastocatellia bacterium]
GHQYNQVQTEFSISYNFSGFSGDKPINLAANRNAYELADFKNESQYVQPEIRKEFKDTAFWQPNVVTGSDGKASVTVPLPDNLTTWRATARAVTTDLRVGSGIVKAIARKDIILRLETPRFLTKGDTAVLSGIVHNYLNSDKVTKISIDVTGATLLDPGEKTVTIAKQGETRIDWRVSASQVGQVTLLAKALTDAESEAVQLPLPIVPAGLQQTTGGVTTISDESAEKTVSLDIPSNADPVARDLRIEVSPSIAGSLFGALDYLTSYPYGCTEQTMSSFLPNVVVFRALKEVQSASIQSGNNLALKVGRGMDRLYGFQHPDGGWGWWKDDKTDPFMTAYVVDGLTLAKEAGYTVDAAKLAQGRDALKQMIAKGKTDSGKTIDLESRAYMIYALRASGDADAGAVNDLYNRRNELQPYGRALLALSLKLYGQTSHASQVAAEIENSATSTGGYSHWQSSRRPMLDFTEDDTLEATALSLKALALIKPSSPAMPGAARWMMANRRYGYYWDSTRQTAFAIFALIDYLKVSKELSPDYTFDVYLNGQQVATHKVTAADATSGAAVVVERKAGEVPSSNQVRIVKHGAGMLYASTTLSYFSNEDQTAPRSSAGLTLSREYLRLHVTEGENKSEWTIEPLKGEVRSGDLLVVRLRVKGDYNRFMMIEDPIPAGCEQVEQVSGINLDYTNGKWSDWYSNREFRDQKTVLFVDYFNGSDTFQYALRVQEPGDFRAAPARATFMYAPWVQANTDGARMTILDKQPGQ